MSIRELSGWAETRSATTSDIPLPCLLPAFIPAGLDTGTPEDPTPALNRWENYYVDTAIPQHHVSFNGVVDLPFGKGKRFLQSPHRFLDALVGGYQVAFIGNVLSQAFQANASNWGATSQVEIYKPCSLRKVLFRRIGDSGTINATGWR
jgi:hypothetical protein